LPVPTISTIIPNHVETTNQEPTQNQSFETPQPNTEFTVEIEPLENDYLQETTYQI